MKKIGIIVPWDSPFMFTANAFNMLNWERPEGYEVKFIIGGGWCPAARHNDGVATAMEWGADFVLFNGGDHVCPKDIIPRMLKRIDEGWDMVQAIVPSRGMCGRTDVPFDAVSYKVVGNMPKYEPMMNAPKESIKIIHGKDEPQQSHICGTGNILMKTEIFKGLEKPYFKEVIKPDGRYSRYPVQDSTFVYNCTILAGAKLFCDTSIKLLHLDIFGIDESYKDRFMDKRANPNWCPTTDIDRFL